MQSFLNRVIIFSDITFFALRQLSLYYLVKQSFSQLYNIFVTNFIETSVSANFDNALAEI